MQKYSGLRSICGRGKRLSTLLILLICVLFLTVSGAFGRDKPSELEFDEDGNYRTKDPGAKIAANFPQITGGVVVLFSEDLWVTPVLGARYRLFPLLKNKKDKTWIKYAQVIAPDFVQLGAGAETILAGVGLELIPEILTFTAGCGWIVPSERGLHFFAGFDILKF